MKKLIAILVFAFICLECQPQTVLPTPSLQLTKKKSDGPVIILKWNPVSEPVLGFVIEKKIDKGQWMIIGQADPKETCYVDNDVKENAYYRIRCYGHETFSAYSNVGISRSLSMR
jgi:hypothetical protein